MAGLIIPFLNRQRFDFTFLASGATTDTTIIPAVNVSMFNTVKLLVRVHEQQMQSGQSLTFDLTSTLPARDDPREINMGGTAFLSLAISSSSGTAPYLLSGSATDPDAFVKITLTAEQGGSPSLPFYAELSAALVVRE